MLATLMLLDRAHRPAYRGLLSTLNFTYAFPYWTIQSLLANHSTEAKSR